MDALEKKSTALEHELVNAQKDHNETIQKMREFEQKSSQLAQNMKRYIFSAQFYFINWFSFSVPAMFVSFDCTASS